jgi:hypothetical protein
MVNKGTGARTRVKHGFTSGAARSKALDRGTSSEAAGSNDVLPPNQPPS